MKKINKWIVALSCIVAASVSAAPVTGSTAVLKNASIQAVFTKQGDVWRSSQLGRVGGADQLDLSSDEFEVLLLDGSRVDVDDYRIVSAERQSLQDVERLEFLYKLKSHRSGNVPSMVKVVYEIGSGPYLHKQVFLAMQEGDVVDRLQVVRFSTSETASRGGEGQPVFLGNWFVGVDYPAFYSRHSDGFKNPKYSYTFHYTINLEGGDRELEPRDGLVTLFHFPGHAKKQANGAWVIQSKRAVFGLSATAGENAELALLDYIEKTRRPARSYLHHNNWYGREDKKLTVDGYVNTFSRTLKDELAKYGATLQGMVPDDGWQQKRDFTKIYTPNTAEPLPEIAAALGEIDLELGIWMALNGATTSIEAGIEAGYRPSIPTDDTVHPRWPGPKYFDLLQPKYLADLKESIRYLLEEANVKYFKHDFNNNYSSYYLNQRHAREACLDITLDLIAYERSLEPNIYINYTNGSTFSPFWLQFMECIWMQSSDSPAYSSYPQLSQREGATSYRDNHFFKSFNNPEVCARPIVPIANFMTHGILFSERKPFTDFKDTLLDWSNYVVMYFGRGTLLKELYTSNKIFDDAHWEVLGKACAWAQQNQSRLMNTVLVGGDCGKGEVYGYVSWVDDRALLVVRNPDRGEQELIIPFDDSVYYRGAEGAAYHARAIYPFVESMPWQLVAGTAITVTVPGDSVQIFELEPGRALAGSELKLSPLAAAQTTVSDEQWTLELQLPDEELPRYDLLIESWKLANAALLINGDAVAATRYNNGKDWTLASYDLRAFRGQTVVLSVSAIPFVDTASEKDKKKRRRPLKILPVGARAAMEAWLVVDRLVDAAPAPADEVLPLSMGQRYRRQTQCLVKEALIVMGE